MPNLICWTAFLLFLLLIDFRITIREAVEVIGFILTIHATVVEVFVSDRLGLTIYPVPYLLTVSLLFWTIILVYNVLAYGYARNILVQSNVYIRSLSAPKMLQIALLDRQCFSSEKDSILRKGQKSEAIAVGKKMLLSQELESGQQKMQFLFQNDTDQFLEPLMTLWKRERDCLALMEYVLRRQDKTELHDQKKIKCFQAVIVVKGLRKSDVYMKDGTISYIDVTTKTLRSNPWLVKVSATVYVNMLYFRVYLHRPGELKLNSQIRKKLKRLLPEEKLKKLVTPSRDLKNNINDFWRTLKTIDEQRLNDEFELI